MKPRHKHNRHRSKHTIKFFSHKSQCHIWCESILERNYALTLEFDGEVYSYASQPDSFKVFGRRYTPDFIVVPKKGKGYFTEVKHTGIIKRTDDFHKKFSLNRIALLNETKLPLKLMTEKDIPSSHCKALKNLYRFIGIDIKAIVSTLELPQFIYFGELCELILDEGPVPITWAMIAQGIYSPESYQSITDDTLLTLDKARG